MGTTQPQRAERLAVSGLHLDARRRGSEAEELVFACASPYGATRHWDRIDALIREGVDLERAAIVADDHRVLPGVAQTLSQWPELASSSEFQAHFDFYVRRQRSANRRLRDQLETVVEAMKVRALTCITYKGPELSALAYGDPDLRDYRDLDMLVRPEDLEAAIEVFETLGYHLVVRQRAWPRRLYRALHHEVTLRKDGEPEIDLHWRLAPPYLWAPDLEFVFDEVTEMNFWGLSVDSLTPENSVLMTCAHGTRHGWQALRLVVDVANLIERQHRIDYAVVRAAAERTGATRMVGVGVGLANVLLGTPVPADLEPLFDADSEIESLVADRAERIHRDVTVPFTHLGGAAFQARCLPRLRDRVRYRARLAALYVAHVLVLVFGARAAGGTRLQRLTAVVTRPVQLLRRHGLNPRVWIDAIRF